MPTIQYTAQLDFTDNGTFETGWRIKQGDFGDCEIVFRVVNNGVNMYDASVTPEIVFRRADGASVISNMTPNDGTYKYTFVGNELAVPGLTLVDVKYTDSEGRISTASCRFTVVEDTIGYDPTGAHTYDNPVSELVEQATAAAETAIDSSFKAEGFAVGEQGGVPVEEGSPYYQNNAEYYCEQASRYAYREIEDHEPYILRQGKGDMVYLDLVGGSFAWNQLVHGEFGSDYTTYWNVYSGTGAVSNNVLTVTNAVGRNGVQLRTDNRLSLQTNHKYLYGFRYKSTVALQYNCVVANQDLPASNSFVDYYKIKSYGGFASGGFLDLFVMTTGETGTFSVQDLMLIDLTQLFGATIADYIYSLEQATAGSGVAWFKQYFPNAYYAYNAGSIQSVNVASRKVVGKNLADVSIGIGKNWDGNTNVKRCWCTWRVPVGDYVVSIDNTDAFSEANVGNSRYPVPLTAAQFNSPGWRNTINLKNSSNRVITVSNEFPYIYISFIATAETISEQDFKDVHFQIERGRTATVYKPYEEYIADFDRAKQLRGIPKLLDSKLIYDGDIYTVDGITRKYGIVDLGSLTWTHDSVGFMYSADIASYIKPPITAASITNSICSHLEQKNAGDIYDGQYGYGVRTNGQVRVRYSGMSTNPTTFKSDVSGWLLVYELATPTTESAEPFQNPQKAFRDGTEEFIDNQVAQSNRDVSIPCGTNSTYISYEIISKLSDYIEGSVKSKVSVTAVGVDESGRLTASKAYAQGDIFYKDGFIGETLTSVASGATWTLNTNYKRTTLAEIVAELRA